MLAGNTGAGNYRHARQILRDRHGSSDWVSLRSIACVCPNESSGKPGALSVDELRKQDAAELGEGRGCRTVLERAQDRLPVGVLQGEDPGTATVGAFEPVGEVGVVDQACELQDVATGDGKAGKLGGGHGALPSIVGLAGSAAGFDEEPTPRDA